MELRLLRYFVAVAEEGHVGRAAQRLRMSQPPLTRAIHQLESDLGAELLQRGPRGVSLTKAGRALYREALAILDRTSRLRASVVAAAGTQRIVVGTCADTADQLGSRLVSRFREECPEIGLELHETDLTDPTAGLRASVVDVALTRAPFEQAAIAIRCLRVDPVGVVVLSDDELAGRGSVMSADLAGRRWVRLPDGTDPVWSEYWSSAGGRLTSFDSPVVRTIQESLQSVLWSGAATFAPLNQNLPDGLVNIPVVDKQPSEIVVAWRRSDDDSAVRTFVEIAAAAH